MFDTLTVSYLSDLFVDFVSCTKILSRDMEQERDRERFNQLWVVMGEVIEVTEFTNRVIHIFNFVLRAFRFVDMFCVLFFFFFFSGSVVEFFLS